MYQSSTDELGKCVFWFARIAYSGQRTGESSFNFFLERWKYSHLFAIGRSCYIAIGDLKCGCSVKEDSFRHSIKWLANSRADLWEVMLTLTNSLLKQKCCAQVTGLNISKPQLPRQRGPLAIRILWRRWLPLFHKWNSVEEFCGSHFFEIIGVAMSGLRACYTQPVFQRYVYIGQEKVLTSKDGAAAAAAAAELTYRYCVCYG